MTETIEHINRVGLSPAQYLAIMTSEAEGDPATVSDDGTRSILRLVAFDRDGRELFQLGPRPAAAQEIFAAAKAEGLEKPDILERLHLFYGRNRGVALDAEFCDLLAGFLDGAK